jgi:RND superfamily putative drug exporter
VLIGLSGLIWFDFMFLRSVGVAGVLVVFFSVLAALTLLPALLGIIGGHVESWRVNPWRVETTDAHREHGFWAALSYKVMHHPVLVLVPTFLVLVVLGAPFLNVSISSPDATILPKSAPSRFGLDTLSDEFGPGEISPFVIAFTTTTSTFSSQNLSALFDYTEWLKAQPGIVRVQGIASFDTALPRDQAVALIGVRKAAAGIGLQPRFNDFASDHAAVLLAYPDSAANSDANKALLHRIRGHPPGGDFKQLVDGGTAEIVDVVNLMYSDFPVAIGLIVAATYLVLLLLFRSLLLPLKAIVMNSLSILASYGALVWIFQEGHLHGLLQFEPLGFVEASLPIIMFCVLFGLSMDYEVFLLSRMREEWDRTGDNTRAVAVGLQRSGQIITSAALIVVVVTASFVSADVVIVKALGLGIALAVFLDATIVRGLLVPAAMRLLGHWNWWLPKPLERVLPGAHLHEES